VAKSKKRAIEVAELQRSKKRRRISLPQSRNVTISSDSRNGSDNIEIQLSGTAVAVANSAISGIRTRNASWRLISLPLRSGRSTNLPSL
jgi:hypothetical protein